jgi:hypothetical protein
VLCSLPDPAVYFFKVQKGPADELFGKLLDILVFLLCRIKIFHGPEIRPMACKFILKKHLEGKFPGLATVHKSAISLQLSAVSTKIKEALRNQLIEQLVSA